MLYYDLPSLKHYDEHPPPPPGELGGRAALVTSALQPPARLIYHAHSCAQPKRNPFSRLAQQQLPTT